MSTMQLPEGITKEMKTEDEILAQLRASQTDPECQNLTFMSDAISPEDAFIAGTNIAPNLEELQKLIHGDVHGSAAHRAASAAATAPAAATPAAATPAAAAAPTVRLDDTSPILNRIRAAAEMNKVRMNS